MPYQDLNTSLKSFVYLNSLTGKPEYSTWTDKATQNINKNAQNKVEDKSKAAEWWLQKEFWKMI